VVTSRTPSATALRWCRRRRRQWRLRKEEGLFKANSVTEEGSERDRSTLLWRRKR
jgi:hypothetical protein